MDTFSYTHRSATSGRDETMTSFGERERRQALRPEPLTPAFATYTRGTGLTELRCRCCGTVIGRMLPVGTQKVRRVKNQTFVDTHLQFAHLANYREVEVEMEGGGRHIGNACADCVPKLGDAEMLARFYETDLAQWRDEGGAELPLLLRAAKPVRVVRSDIAIKD